ncbi:MATE family efflux transporter [Ideonella sp. DXS22W]|uniref:MATE family efflux transporter n=1 Tax=Pseudaquabacterium inlustre TaxID=2984192 RepID=A0ABU9CNM6_9BURK
MTSVSRSFMARPRLLPLAGPLFAELLLGIAVGVLGTVLAARLGDRHGAAFALANQVLAMLFIFFRIVGAGVGVVVSQALGGRRRDEADRVARATLGAATWIGGLGALGALLGAGPLLRLMNAPPEVLPLATVFLQTLAPAVLLDAWNATLASVLRSHLQARPTLRVIVATQLLHLGLAWPAMSDASWGWGLGLPGFALALLASRVLGVLLLGQLWRQRLGLHTVASDWWCLPRRTLAPVLHIGLPGAAENIAWRLAFMVSVAVVGGMGTAAVATQAYTMQVMHLLLLTGLATGLSAEIVVGHLVGAGRLHEAHRLVRRAMGVGLLVSGGLALLAALAGPRLLGLFTDDAAIVAAGATLLWLTPLLETGRTFNLVLVNALRAAGDARYPVLAGAASFALVLAGGSWLLGSQLGLGLAGVWVAYAADEWIRGLLMWRRWAGQGWVPHARQAHRRLRLARQ